MSNTVEGELAVRNLLSRYSDAVWRMDKDAWGATWAEDGRWEIVGMVVEGRDNIVKAWLGFMENAIRNVQIVHGELLDIGADRGTGRVHLNEILTEASGTTKVTMGIYEDEYVRRDGVWQFKKRAFTLAYYGKPDYSDPFAEQGGFPRNSANL